MPTPSGYQPDPIEELTVYIKDWLKSLQVYVDNLAPYPEQDNTLLPLLGIPYQFDTTVGVSCAINDGTADYSGWQYGYGHQTVGFLQRVTLMNNSLRYGELNYIGKILTGNPGRWDLLTPAEQDDAVDKCLNVISGLLVANYTGDVKMTAYISSVTFQINNYNDSYYIDWVDRNGSHVSSNGNPSVSFSTSVITEDADGLLQGSFSDYSTLNRFVMQDRTIIAVVDSDTQAQYIVNSRSSVNRDTLTKVCLSGATYKLYYGDNYLVYVVDNTKIYTYYDMYEGTKTAAQQINDWTPGSPVIHVPTYDESKYGPEPEPGDIDDDIEVEMELNDAAYGAGMSHYYVTTTTSGVLDDISAAMSTWNINNTGKDLYRNLLSCRLTKVGPIPAKNSTFVIYGEELQYNGAPISINEITGNPSMDLGEYEILPKFNDFRDYAPYTKIEMHIPYCGWVALPSHCMSSEEDPKIITGTLLCDIIAGTCKAVIKCNDTVVAEAAGFTAVDVPFVGENVGMKMAGIASSITSYGSNAAKTVGGIAGGMSGGGPAGAAAAGGVVSLLGSYAQLNAAFNANYTEICGKTGDGCNVAGLNKVYIKIQRPKTNGYEEPDFVPGDYGHTTGFLCMQKLKVSDCKGLIIASNADISGIGSATDAERAEIKRVLETGLFVNAAPEPEE